MLFKSKLRVFVVFLFVGLSFGAWAENKVSKIPGTSVTISKIEGFEISKSFTGYSNPSNGSSVLIAELPKEAYSQLSKLFGDINGARKGFAQKGVKILEAKSVSSRGKSIPILIGTQSVSGVNVDKYIALIQGDKTVMVTYNIFDSDEFEENDAIHSIKTIIAGKAASLEEKLDLLSFTFDSALPFKTADVLGGSGAMLTTFNGTDKSGELPIIVIVSSFSKVKISDEKLYSESLLRSISGFNTHTVKSDTIQNFAGVKAYQIEVESDNKTAIQIVSFRKDGSYLRLVVTGNTKKVKELNEVINEIILSVKVKA